MMITKKLLIAEFNKLRLDSKIISVELKGVDDLMQGNY